MNTTQCEKCKDAVGQGPICSSCEKTFHFHCSGTTERNFNKLGTNRNSWKCPHCRNEGSAPNVSATLENKACIKSVEETLKPDTLNSILLKLSEMQVQLASISIIQSDISQVKNDINDLKGSINAKFEELSERVITIEGKVVELERCKSQIADMKTEISEIHLELSNREQQQFRKDIELTGLTEHPNENLPHLTMTLAATLGVELDPRDVDDIRRVGLKGGKNGGDDRPRPVIITFTRREVRDRMLRAAKARRGVTTDKFEVPGNSRRIFINEHLTKNNRILYSKSRAAGNDLKFKYVWTNNGNIFMRRSDTSSIVRVTSDSILQKLRSNASNRAQTSDGVSEL